MKTLLVSIAVGMGALLSQDILAADAPAAAHTAQCKDGSYYDGTTHKGACRGHQGVKEWLDGSSTKSDASSTSAASDDSSKKKGKKAKADATAAAPAAAPTAAPAPAPAATPAPAPAPAATTKPATTSTTEHKAPTPASQITQKPGGGAGLVWVNSESKVYHCQGDEWYGKTKQGSYMSVADAEKAGAKPSHGKACQ